MFIISSYVLQNHYYRSIITYSYNSITTKDIVLSGSISIETIKNVQLFKFNKMKNLGVVQLTFRNINNNHLNFSSKIRKDQPLLSLLISGGR